MTCFIAISNFRQSIFVRDITPPTATILSYDESLKVVNFLIVFHTFLL